MNTSALSDAMRPSNPKALHSTLPFRDVIKPYSTLIALVILMVFFELAGRVWNSEVQSQVMGWVRGEQALNMDAIANGVVSGFGSADAAFFTARNLTNLSLQVSLNGILAIGMTMVILTGGIDLGIGSVVALCGICLGIAQAKWGWSLGSSLAMALAVGTAVGGVNGFLISRFKIPPFVVTLGFLVIARGLALIFSGASAISPLSESVQFLGGGFVSPWVLAALLVIGAGLTFFLSRDSSTRAAPSAENAVGSPASADALQNEAVHRELRSHRTGGLLEKVLPAVMFVALGGLSLWAFFSDRGLPTPVLILVVGAALGMFVLGRTTFGRGLYALGGNETAAILSGIPVQRIKFLVYVFMGLLAGVAGIILSGRLNSATPTEGQLMELDAIAAVVIGGTSLQGGVGRIQGSIVGAFIIGVLNNGMDMLELSTDYQMVMKGLIIVFAVWSDSRAGRK